MYSNWNELKEYQQQVRLQRQYIGEALLESMQSDSGEKGDQVWWKNLEPGDVLWALDWMRAIYRRFASGKQSS